MSIEYQDLRKDNRKIRACVYIRFSSQKQADSFSVEYQKEECLRYIENEGYTFVKFYIDEAKTAKKTAGREALEQMVLEAAHNIFDKIIVFSFSRSFRNTRDALNYNYELMGKHGIPIESVIEPIDLSSPHGKFSGTNLFAMNELQSDITAAHVRSGMNVAARQGYYLGGYVPYGYELYETGEMTRGKPRKKFKINEEEAEIVKEMFALYAQNFSLNYIQQTMRDKGVVGRKGKIISFQTICRILRNPFYIGFRDYQIKGYDKIYEDIMPAIISPDLWNAVQSRHEINKVAFPVVPRRTKRLYALTGKLYCSKCGMHLTGTYKGNKHKPEWSYSYYVCISKHGRRTCDLKNIRKDFIENYCLEQIKLHILNPEKINEIAEHIVQQADNSPKQLTAELSRLTRREKELFEYIKAAEKSKIEAEANGSEIKVNATKEIIADYERELAEIYTTLDRLKTLENTTITVDNVKDYLNALLSDVESVDPHIIKSVFDKLIEKVEVFDDKVIVYLIVNIFVFNRDNFSQGQPQFNISASTSKQ